MDMDISKLYPPVNFPVSRGTKMISPLIKWDHSQKHFVPLYEPYFVNDKRSIVISLHDPRYKYLEGHSIDGSVVLPASGYIFWAWETFAMMLGMDYREFKVQIDNLKFHRATYLVESSSVVLTISITRGTNRFEITEGSTAIATGYIKTIDSSSSIMTDIKETAPIINTTTLYENDVYKVAKLKGYQYTNQFKSLKEVRSDANYAKVRWNTNWIVFLDGLLQVDIIKSHSKSFGLPRSIRKIIIDPEIHENFCSETEIDEVIIEARRCEYFDIVRAGGVEFNGFISHAVNRRRFNIKNSLESYHFVPHFPTPNLTIKEMSQFVLQIISENLSMKSLKLVELDGNDGKLPLSKYFYDTAINTPLISVECFYVTTQTVEIGNVTVQVGDSISPFSDSNIIITSNGNQNFFDSVTSSVISSCFIVTRGIESVELLQNFRLLSRIISENEDFLLIKYDPERNRYEDKNHAIEITSNIDDYEWLTELKTSIMVGCHCILYSQPAELSGILGLVNCLRKEFDERQISCFLIDDNSAPKFDFDDPFYKNQLELGLSMNVYRNGAWGTYRHMPLAREHETSLQNAECYIDSLVRGDLSKLTWVKRLDYERKPSTQVVDIHYSALNFRDVMIATGKIEPFGLKNKLKQQTSLGLEFSGFISGTNQRVMGIAHSSGGLATSFKVKDAALFAIPDSWSLEEAATVPLVYATVYLAFFIHSDIRKGKSILIHAGSGGVGLAAIRVSLAYGLTVFTTVSTDMKRNYLLEIFPQLNQELIGNSRDTSFEAMVLQKTNGRGVDFVLNSLADEKLQASLRCVAENGTFFEIGKYDILNGTKISLGDFKKGINFKPVFLGPTNIDEIEVRLWTIVYKMINNNQFSFAGNWIHEK